MLSALLTALGLLINTLTSLSSSDSRRRRLAKDICILHEDIERIVACGRELLSYAKVVDKPIATDIPIVLLRSQQADLIAFKEHFLNLARVLSIHMPIETGRLQVITEFKSIRVALLLTFLVDNLPAASSESGEISLSTQKLLDEYVESGLELHPAAQIELPDRTWNADFDLMPRLIASPSDVRAAYQVLDEIVKAQEELRKFIVEKFEVQDLL